MTILLLNDNISLAVAKRKAFAEANERKCWNWQTGMTKDHVYQVREGSSPFFRRITPELYSGVFLYQETEYETNIMERKWNQSLYE